MSSEICRREGDVLEELLLDLDPSLFLLLCGPISFILSFVGEIMLFCNIYKTKKIIE